MFIEGGVGTAVSSPGRQFLPRGTGIPADMAAVAE
jgi:hypothetical protein